MAELLPVNAELGRRRKKSIRLRQRRLETPQPEFKSA
jgi:hypothetical protein